MKESSPLADKGFNNIAANKEFKMRTSVQNELDEIVKRKSVTNSENKEELNNIFKNMSSKNDTFKVDINSLEKNQSNNDEVINSVKNVKNLFENKSDEPKNKILSLSELVQKDNLNTINIKYIFIPYNIEYKEYKNIMLHYSVMIFQKLKV